MLNFNMLKNVKEMLKVLRVHFTLQFYIFPEGLIIIICTPILRTGLLL